MCITAAAARLRSKPLLAMNYDLPFQYWLEVEHENESQDQTRFAVAALIVGSSEDHTWVIENLRSHR